MLIQNIYYQEERKYATDRFLALVVLTLLSFVLSGQASGALAEKLVLTGFIFLVLDLFSLAHFYFLSIYPSTLVSLRKNLLIFIDIAVLTYLILIYGKIGLYFLPFYILIVMRSGLSFGVHFFYASLLFVSASWIVLLFYSDYWRGHNDVLAVSAMTTFLIPLFYLKFIVQYHEENVELVQALEDAPEKKDYDELTGLANRQAYKEKVEALLHEKLPFALLFIDLDKFEAINEMHGKHVGDEILKEVAKRLLENIDKDDFLARLGEDEFVIITQRKKVYMDKLIAKLEYNVIGRHKIGKQYIPIELSIGISYYPEDNQNAMMLAKYADEAMRKAKADENRCHYFYHELYEGTDTRTKKH
jgi:diguanylate cyclase (GGDEF)-like protein